MDTEYTKGFLAGMTWSEERIIKLIEKLDGWDWIEIRTQDLIALIEGEQK